VASTLFGAAGVSMELGDWADADAAIKDTIKKFKVFIEYCSFFCLA